MAGSAYLNHVLYGLNEEGADSRPSLLTLDDIEASIAAAVEVAESLPDIGVVEPSIFDNVIYDGEVVERTVYAEVVSGDEDTDRTTTVDVALWGASQSNGAFYVDFDKHENDFLTSQAAYDPSISSVEVISDDDFDFAVGAKKATVASEGQVEKGEMKEKSIIGFVLLRGLDIFVLVIEKIFTVSIFSAVAWLDHCLKSTPHLASAYSPHSLLLYLVCHSGSNCHWIYSLKKVC
jgi:hypothetical protein